MTTQTVNASMSDRLTRALQFAPQPIGQPPQATAVPVAPGTAGLAGDRVSLSTQPYESGTAPPAYLGALATSLAGSSESSPAPAPRRALKLPPGYATLENLGSELARRDPRFSTDSADGRSATALAMAIGGTEVYGKGSRGTDFFTRRGGTGKNMLGFGQFNLAYHRQATSSPARYTRFMGDILTGKKGMPNGRRGSNHASALSQAVESGQIKNGKDLLRFMKQRGFGGSNWQGIDDGWGRNPGLADGLVRFLRGSGS